MKAYVSFWIQIEIETPVRLTELLEASALFA